MDKERKTWLFKPSFLLFTRNIKSFFAQTEGYSRNFEKKSLSSQNGRG